MVQAPPEKHLRAAFSRPSLEEVIAFRMHVDQAMETLFANHIKLVAGCAVTADGGQLRHSPAERRAAVRYGCGKRRGDSRPGV